MKISIITVCFNSKHTISDTLSSLFSQALVELEYIVIDGDSADGTTDILRESIEKIAFYSSEPDKGIYDALNKGISRATGDVIGFLHSDDFFVDKYSLFKVVQKFQSKSIDIVIGGANLVHRNNEHLIKGSIRPRILTIDDFRGGRMPPHISTFYRREFFLRTGDFSLRYTVASDFDWMLRAMIHNEPAVEIIDEPLVVMRLGGISASGLKSYVRITFEILDSLKKNDVRPKVFRVIFRGLRKYLERFGLEAYY